MYMGKKKKKKKKKKKHPSLSTYCCSWGVLVHPAPQYRGQPAAEHTAPGTAPHSLPATILYQRTNTHTYNTQAVLLFIYYFLNWGVFFWKWRLDTTFKKKEIHTNLVWKIRSFETPTKYLHKNEDKKSDSINVKELLASIYKITLMIWSPLTWPDLPLTCHTRRRHQPHRHTEATQHPCWPLTPEEHDRDQVT